MNKKRSWLEESATPKPDGVCIAYVHPGIVTEPFARSLAELCLWKKNRIAGVISVQNPRQEVARNEGIRSFLKLQAEWLMWVDTDMSCDRDAIEKLLATANKHKADIVSGLGFIYKRTAQEIIPNGYMWSEELNYYVEIDDYKPGKVYEIDATGSGFILINRRVFEAWDNEFWHETWREHPRTGTPMGHDVAFCETSKRELGFKIVWDTNVRTGHVKPFQLTETNYLAYRESLK